MNCIHVYFPNISSFHQQRVEGLWSVRVTLSYGGTYRLFRLVQQIILVGTSQRRPAAEAKDEDRRFLKVNGGQVHEICRFAMVCIITLT